MSSALRLFDLNELVLRWDESAQSRLTQLETAVLEAICEHEPIHGPLLGTALARARVTDRENTGAGFYTEFTIEGGSSGRFDRVRFRSRDSYAAHPSAKFPCRSQVRARLRWASTCWGRSVRQRV